MLFQMHWLISSKSNYVIKLANTYLLLYQAKIFRQKSCFLQWKLKFLQQTRNPCLWYHVLKLTEKFNINGVNVISWLHINHTDTGWPNCLVSNCRDMRLTSVSHWFEVDRRAAVDHDHMTIIWATHQVFPIRLVPVDHMYDKIPCQFINREFDLFFSSVYYI